MGDICKIQRGASPRPINKYFTDSPDGVNWIKIGDTDVNSKYITSTSEKITKEGADKSRLVKEGDFILSNSMSFGRPYILKITGYIHDGWLLLSEINKKIDKDYLYYILGSEDVREQFELSATGGVVRNLNSELVRHVKIPVPDIEYQQGLSSSMAEMEEVVESNKKLIDLMEKKIEEVLSEI